MALGDLPDIVSRLRGLLPRRWFPDDPDASPVLEGTLAGQASLWAALFDQLQSTKQQTRIATLTGPFLDLASRDFFASDLPRKAGETDDSFRARIQAYLLRPRGTRQAVASILEALTGSVPVIIEPWNTGDCGGWDTPGFVWDTAGAWGDLDLPWQMFVIAYRPVVTLAGASGFAGWDSQLGGWDVPALGLIDTTTAKSVPADSEIYAVIAATMPAGTIAWTQIQPPPVRTILTGSGVATAGGSGVATVTGTGTAQPQAPSSGFASDSGSGLTTDDGTAIAPDQG